MQLQAGYRKTDKLYSLLWIPGTSTPTFRISQAQVCLPLEPLSSLRCQKPYLRQGLKHRRWNLNIRRDGTKSISGIPILSNRERPSSVWILLHIPKIFLESQIWGGVRGSEGWRMRRVLVVIEDIVQGLLLASENGLKIPPDFSQLLHTSCFCQIRYLSMGFC